jgi:hypothetical protein
VCFINYDMQMWIAFASLRRRERRNGRSVLLKLHVSAVFVCKLGWICRKLCQTSHTYNAVCIRHTSVYVSVCIYMYIYICIYIYEHGNGSRVLV